MIKINKGKNVAITICLIVLTIGLNKAFAQSKGMGMTEKDGKGIVFVNGKWKDIAAKAKKSGKYIFVDVYTSWCAPCRQLKNVTFKDEKAAAYYNKSFINYTVDMEKGEGVALADKWNVTAYPALLFFTPEGKMIMKQVGYVDGEHLVDFGKQALARK